MLFDTLEDLAQYLEKNALNTCYLIYSPDNFLLQQARETIKLNAKAQGIVQCCTWEISSSLDWHQIHAVQSPSLFNERLLIDLRWSQSFNEALSQKVTQFLNEIYTHDQTDHHLFLVSLINITPAIYRANWFQSLLTKGTLISLAKPDAMNFSPWLSKRLKSINLHLDEKALLYFSRVVENNFIAAEQVIKKLMLIYNTQTPILLNLKQIKTIVTDYANFEINALIDAIIAGKAERCLRILYHLQTKNVATPLILGYLVRILRLLSSLYYTIKENISLSTAFKKHRVWKVQQHYFQNALSYCNEPTLKAFFQLVHQMDQIIKGATQGDGWQTLQVLVLKLVSLSRQSIENIQLPCG